MVFSRKIAGIIIASIIVIVVSAGTSLNSESDEIKTTAQKMNFEFIDILEECMDTTSITSLNMCKIKLREMNDQCNSNELLNSMTFCNDDRINEFYETVEDRIELAKTKIVDVVEDSDLANLRMIELCFEKKSSEEMDFCKETLMAIKESCKMPENSLMSSCNDPRIDEILGMDSSNLQCSGNARCITGIVTQIIDGDTIKVDGQSIRFALVDAPEIKYDGGKGRNFIEEICPVGSTVVVDQDDSQLEDKYGRILGVIFCNNLNLNKELIDSGIGDLYSAFCDQSEFATHSWAQKHGCEATFSESNQSDCEASYPDFCIPTSPPDLDCGDIPQKGFTVLQPDPHRFDGDGDGIGCES